MPPKDATITVKIESQIAQKLNELIQKLETRMEALKPELFKDKLYEIVSDLHDASTRIEDIGRTLQSVIEDKRYYRYTKGPTYHVEPAYQDLDSISESEG